MKKLDYKTKRVNQISHLFQEIYLLLLFLCTSAFSQGTFLKTVTEKDYSLWGTMYDFSLSAKGTWISSYMHYDEYPDTLHLKQVQGDKTHKIPNPGKGTFFGENKYAVMSDKSTLQIIDLQSGKSEFLSNVYSFGIATKPNLLITVEQAGEQKDLVVRNYEGKVLETLEGFSIFKLSPKSDAMICIGSNNGTQQLVGIQFEKQLSKVLITEEPMVEFSQPVWSESSLSFAFVKKSKNPDQTGICFYSTKTKQLDEFVKEKSFFPNNFKLNLNNVTLSISPDDQRVVFDLYKENVSDTLSKVVQIWNGNDGLVYPKRKKITAIEKTIRYAVWWPKKNKLRFITNDRCPIHLLNPTMDFAITYSMSDKKPDYLMKGIVDFYITNLETGHEELLVNNQSTDHNFYGFSPNGQFFTYNNESRWFLYDLKKHQNVVIDPMGVIKSDYLEHGNKSTFGIAGWGTTNDCLFLYDTHDVWKVPFDGSDPIRITNGMEQKRIFRVEHFNNNVASILSGSSYVDLSKDILLSTTSTDSTGYVIRKPNGRLKKVVYDRGLNKPIVKAENVPLYLYQSQHFSQPHALNSYNAKTAVNNCEFQSNPHHYKYLWGKQQQIYFTNSKNEKLKAILYFPIDYNPEKKYPMVVSIYEELNFLKHYYFNPTIYTQAGFNVTNLTAQGYFVLLPDIVYEMGNPGISATDCVVAATTEVIDMGIIVPDKIALIGHSFGGYETNFIITQTSLFKTAISGASVFDLPSWYLSISKNWGESEIWRFESQQWRMGNSLYSDKEGYERNSPSTWVENVKVPLLLWTGENDTQINPDQSIAYYLALRRLNKKSIMLIYSNESHSLIKKESQRDLYKRLKEWLDYFLNDNQPADWIVSGLK